MDQSPRWPLWLPVAAIGCGVSFGLLALSVIAGIAQSTKGPGITIAGTVLVDLSVVVAAVLLAGTVRPPRPWQFGLRGAPLKFAAQMAILGAAAYFVFTLVYAAIVRPDNPQRVVEDLGADTSNLLLVVGALVVIVPILAALGVMFCYVYERTGSIFPTIALHALNNTIAYGDQTDWGVALTVGGLVIAACAYALLRAPRRDPAGVTG